MSLGSASRRVRFMESVTPEKFVTLISLVGANLMPLPVRFTRLQ